MKESDMYLPLKEFLEADGYTIRGEVNHADIVGVKDDKIIIVEMKTSFNLKLVYQILERQRMTDFVYAAVLVNYKSRRSKAFQNMKKLLKRLSVGLIIVYTKKTGLVVECIQEPEFSRYNRSHKKEKSLLYEFENRSADFNIGGVTREKIMTVYREQCIQIGCLLEKEGQLTLKEIKNRTGIEKTATILQKNHYGWFERVSRGCYKLSDTAISEIKDGSNIYGIHLK